jgi:hypothetical protein
MKIITILTAFQWHFSPIFKHHFQPNILTAFQWRRPLDAPCRAACTAPSAPRHAVLAVAPRRVRDEPTPHCAHRRFTPNLRRACAALPCSAVRVARLFAQRRSFKSVTIERGINVFSLFSLFIIFILNH